MKINDDIILSHGLKLDEYSKIKSFSISVNFNTEKKDIFSNLNLKIQKNSRIGIIGSNGSGKSTCEEHFGQLTALVCDPPA